MSKESDLETTLNAALAPGAILLFSLLLPWTPVDGATEATGGWQWLGPWAWLLVVAGSAPFLAPVALTIRLRVLRRKAPDVWSLGSFEFGVYGLIAVLCLAGIGLLVIRGGGITGDALLKLLTSKTPGALGDALKSSAGLVVALAAFTTLFGICITHVRRVEYAVWAELAKRGGTEDPADDRPEPSPLPQPREHSGIDVVQAAALVAAVQRRAVKAQATRQAADVQHASAHLLLLRR